MLVGRLALKLCSSPMNGPAANADVVSRRRMGTIRIMATGTEVRRVALVQRVARRREGSGSWNDTSRVPIHSLPIA
jgi:hypothetical protein